MATVAPAGSGCQRSSADTCVDRDIGNALIVRRAVHTGTDPDPGALHHLTGASSTGLAATRLRGPVMFGECGRARPATAARSVELGRLMRPTRKAKITRG
ncbi:hypothetical protein Psi02_66880 [Planotetraspora silvatica]|uniref:Uncharacterized protein n=1 Tax=Planotetraspora silvatica TaxID=234614 RepID=A0A8J3UXK9_9ACTN|nr:hypothetical protein Psi02_66880 [Planotetraspora silvatica]